MKRARLMLAAAGSAALLVAVLAPVAFAAPNAPCTGTLPPGTYQNVTVPTGQACTIDTSNVVLGNVSVGLDATLTDGVFGGGGASIGGNLNADHANAIRVFGGSVGGNVHATATSGPVFSEMCDVTVGKNVVVQGSGPGAFWFFCAPNLIGGNLTVQNNAGIVDVRANKVEGNISVHNNKGRFVGILVGNSAGGNCQLFNNDPPFFGNGNSAGGINTCNRHA